MFAQVIMLLISGSWGVYSVLRLFELYFIESDKKKFANRQNIWIYINTGCSWGLFNIYFSQLIEGLSSPMKLMVTGIETILFLAILIVLYSVVKKRKASHEN